MKKNPISRYIEKKNADLTPEEIQKRQDLEAMLTKELELMRNSKKDKVLYKYNKDYSSFRIDKLKYIILLICEVVLYVILGIYETALSQRLIVIVPFLCMTVPMLVFLFRIFHALSMVEVMAGRMYNRMVVSLLKYSKVMLFCGILMLVGDIVLFISNVSSIDKTKEAIYMLFIVVLSVFSFILSMHTVSFKRKMSNY